MNGKLPRFRVVSMVVFSNVRDPYDGEKPETLAERREN